MAMTVHDNDLVLIISCIQSLTTSNNLCLWCPFLCWDHPTTLRFSVLAGLAFMFSASILLQILACALYNNWWPMIASLMYVLVPMPCLFFGGGSVHFLTSRDGGGWIDAAKFLTGASSVGSIAIPIILRHAHLIATGAMFIQIFSFLIFVCTVLCFHRVSLDDDW